MEDAPEKELNYEIDNRDSSTTWLTISDGNCLVLGHLELRVEDMFDLIENVMENNPEMDTSELETRTEELYHKIYGQE